MGSELGQLHHELSQQLMWLHSKWAEYRALYGHSAETVQRLNAAAPFFFGILQRILFDDVMLHLARLTDPPTSFGRENLTFQRLPPLVDQRIRRKVERGVKRVLKATEFARDRRNRTIAHCDLPTLRNLHPKRLAHASRLRVGRALAEMARLMNDVESHYEGSEVMYRGISEPGGAQTLLWKLQGERLVRRPKANTEA
jgi:hypothetical protein